jgi:uncharacterized protein (DUF427 family)
MTSSPAYARHPEHHVELTEKAGRVRVEFAGRTIADSARSLLVLESHHDPVVYFPREDVAMDLLERAVDTTFCPFKGTASYYTIRVGDRTARTAVWSYEAPYDEVAGLAHYLAFYGDRIDALIED